MMKNEKIATLKRNANRLPLLPGVYIMYSADNKIIYIGKAKALKNRVTQYFGSEKNHSTKVKRMVENVDRFEYVVCDTEFEAFILENSLIKQHQPKYNILLKDDKGYHYIKISNDKWRKICAVKQKTNDGKYIGPYNSGVIVKNTVDEALKVFKLPTCNRSFDKPSKPCLNYHIGICSAPCKGNISLSNYNEQVDAAVSFIKKGGYTEKDLAVLNEKMLNAAENLDFEYAAKIRDRISAIKKITQKQKVVSATYENQDILCSVTSKNALCIQLLKFRGGKLVDQNHYFFDNDLSKAELYSQFLSQYYNTNDDIPPRIFIDELPDETEFLEKLLSEKIGKKCVIAVPKIGEQKQLVEMCRKNAAENLSKKLERGATETKALDELAGLLKLGKAPECIEAYDISNTQGSENVGVMVTFLNGVPYKNGYRKFKIKSFMGQDDFRSMAEVLDRRFAEYVKGEDESFSRLPDLILLDGGEGQISAVLPVLEKYNLDINLFGMVKDSKHRTRAISSSGGDIAIKSTRSVFTLITKIQDEVHRFAITYHKKRSSASMLESKLLKINGIGKTRANALLKHFKSISKIENADISELLTVKGMNEVSAKNVYEYFKK